MFFLAQFFCTVVSCWRCWEFLLRNWRYLEIWFYLVQYFAGLVSQYGTKQRRKDWISCIFWKGQRHDIFCLKFFHKSSSPKPLKKTVGSSQIFPQILRHTVFASQGVPPVLMTPALNLSTILLVLLIPGANNGNNIKKFIYIWTVLPKGVQTKYLKLLLLRIFSICRWHRWYTLSCEYLLEFSKKFGTALRGSSGA